MVGVDTVQLKHIRRLSGFLGGEAEFDIPIYRLDIAGRTANDRPADSREFVAIGLIVRGVVERGYCTCGVLEITSRKRATSPALMTHVPA